MIKWEPMHLFVDNLNIDLPRFGALTPSSPEYLLPSHWVQVLAPTYLLPRGAE